MTCVLRVEIDVSVKEVTVNRLSLYKEYYIYSLN